MIVRRLLPAITTVLALGESGCIENRGTAADAPFAIDSSGRFPVVTAHGRAERWLATPLYSVGATEGDTIDFAYVRSVLLDSAGTLIVVDQRIVREFDSTGTFVRQIGRDGAGPGEYRRPFSVAWLDGNLALLDPGNPRLALFDRGGGWITSWPIQPITGPMIRLHRTQPSFSAFGYRPTPTGAGQFYVQYDASGPRDTVAQAPGPTDLDTGIRCNRPDKAISFYSNPFAAAFLQIPLGNGRIAVARTDAYRIAVLGRNLDTTMVITADITASPVTDADWTAGLRDWEKFRRDWPTAQCNKTSFDRPAVKPVLNWLFIDGGGRLWVEVLTSEGTRYDIFDMTGRPQASVDGLPPSGGIDPTVAGNRAAFVVSDTATDVRSVRVFRLEPAPGGR
jgi:6-bladed beta-propeller protein